MAMRERIILGFDIKGFSLPSSLERREITRKLEDLITKFYKRKESYIFIPTGDGYFIGFSPSRKSNSKVLEFIPYLMDNLEEVEVRYALSIGKVEKIENPDRQDTYVGDVFIETERIMNAIPSGNVILASDSYYQNFISAKLTNEKEFDEQFTIETMKSISVVDKHNIPHTAYNISIHNNGHKYGFEYQENGHEPNPLEDAVEAAHYGSILAGSFPMRKITHVATESDSQQRIKYHYFRVALSNFTHESFLFLDKNINKIATIEHFLDNQETQGPLTICANKKHVDESRNQFWKDDFIKKLTDTSCLIRHRDFEFRFLDEFIWENCIDRGSAEDEFALESEPYYVNPLAESGDSSQHSLNVVKYLESWVADGTSPIFVLLGEGGIGKTTVLKMFANRINKSNIKKLALYIDASLIVSNTVYDQRFADKISTVYDLLSLYFTMVSPETAFSFSNNKDFIDLIISSGNIIIVIDGLDEIAASLKENFSTHDFVANISDVNGLLNHTKVICSSRNYYWSTELSTFASNAFERLMLKGFDESMARKYFEKKLGKGDERIAHAFTVLKSFSRKSSQGFSPFVVYLVSDLVQKRDSDLDAIEFDSKYLQVDYVFDNIIAQVCERERLRQSLDLNLDDFMELFFEIVFVSQNTMAYEDFMEYVSIALENKVKYFKPLLSNPFLSVKDHRISVSHNSVENHLIVIFLAYHILNPKIRNNAVYRVLARYCDGKIDTLVDLKRRVEAAPGFVDAFKLFFTQTLRQLRNEREIRTRFFLEKSISTLLYLAMSSSRLGNISTPTDRMRIVKELYSNELDNLHIYDEFCSLDFRNVRVRNSSFTNYKGFFKSHFDSETRFIDTRFNQMLSENLDMVKHTNLTSENFDTSCTYTDEFGSMFPKRHGRDTVMLRFIQGDLMNFFKKFYSRNTRFVPLARDSLKVSLRSGIEFPLFLQLLERERIVEKDSQKNYRINQEYKDSVSKFISNNYADNAMNRLIKKLSAVGKD